jgi:hypothetical protein
MQKADRRHYFRIEVNDTWAYCCGDKQGGRYKVENLGMGSAMLSGEPPLPLNTSFDLHLYFPDGESLRMDGFVVRHRECSPTKTPQFAIDFGYLSDGEQDILADFITGKVERQLTT